MLRCWPATSPPAKCCTIHPTSRRRGHWTQPSRRATRSDRERGTAQSRRRERSWKLIAPPDDWATRTTSPLECNRNNFGYLVIWSRNTHPASQECIQQRRRTRCTTSAEDVRRRRWPSRPGRCPQCACWWHRRTDSARCRRCRWSLTVYWPPACSTLTISSAFRGAPCLRSCDRCVCVSVASML